MWVPVRHLADDSDQCLKEHGRQVYRRRGGFSFPISVSPDRTLLLVQGGENTRADVFALPPAGGDAGSTVSSRGIDHYPQVFPDGQRFLVARPSAAQGVGAEMPLTVVLNWAAAIR